MQIDMRNKEIKTKGYVLRRTNYGEADRILNILTPVGKMSVMARGVRKERSKLAGGIEMMTLSDYVIHFGRGEMGILTSVKMVKYYGKLMSDYSMMELIGKILKKCYAVSENIDNEEFFAILDQVFNALDKGVGRERVEAWFILNIGKAVGEQVNLYYDGSGAKLSQEEKYVWDGMDGAFRVDKNGEYGADEIKLMRLMLSVKLEAMAKVKVEDKIVRRVLELCRRIGNW